LEFVVINSNTTTMKIVVTGANGQLGKCIHDVSVEFPQHQFIFLGREHFALEQFGMVNTVLLALQPDVVINAAAYTAVDKAEQESDLAFLINGEAVGHLASVCNALNIRLIHISTDYVFDGTKSTPYVETDAVNPIGVYGKSKLLGEQLIAESNHEATIIRTSWVYSRHGSNFVKTMLRLMKEKEQINVVNDQYGCPTYAIDFARAICNILSQKNAPAGIFHYSNSGPISWFDFANVIAKKIVSHCTVNPISTSQYPTLAKRPKWSQLSNDKMNRTFHLQTIDWEHSLDDCLQHLR
jgi:dTDP-4-dehydrorhamnose reductase